MVMRVDSFKCEICDTYYISEEEAKECEEYHIEYKKLELCEVFYKKDFEYPYAIIIDNGSGHSGLYILDTESSVETVYESFQNLRRRTLIDTVMDDDEY